MGVVDNRQNGSGFRHVREQSDRDDRGDQAVGGGSRGEAKRAQEGLRLALRKVGRGFEHHEHVTARWYRVDEGPELGELGFAAHQEPGASGRFIQHFSALPDQGFRAGGPMCSHAYVIPPMSPPR